MADHHDHDHDGHSHPEGHSPHSWRLIDTPIDRHEHEMTYWEKRIMSVMFLLIEKGVVTLDEIRYKIEQMEQKSPELGARVVARAWVDPDFKRRLLEDATKAVREYGLEPLAPGQSKLVALENTDKVHHIVVCTLCSCYPIPLLGFPPDWYKSEVYRQRAVSNPRAVLKEFGVELEPDVEVRVVDSIADCRYLVIPRRPEGTEGLTESQLASLVTRDSMIGTGLARSPLTTAPV